MTALHIISILIAFILGALVFYAGMKYQEKRFGRMLQGLIPEGTEPTVSEIRAKFDQPTRNVIDINWDEDSP